MHLIGNKQKNIQVNLWKNNLSLRLEYVFAMVSNKSIKNFAIVFGTLFATIAQISNKQLNFLTTDCHIFVKWSLKREEQEPYHNSRLIYFLRPWVSKYHANWLYDTIEIVPNLELLFQCVLIEYTSWHFYGYIQKSFNIIWN